MSLQRHDRVVVVVVVAVVLRGHHGLLHVDENGQDRTGQDRTGE